MKKISIHAIISGKVQGVFYRKHAAEKAKSLGLTGWVKNNIDGTVELIASGEKHTVETFIAWLWQGPEKAVVENVSHREIDYQSFEHFTIAAT